MMLQFPEAIPNCGVAADAGAELLPPQPDHKSMDKLIIAKNERRMRPPVWANCLKAWGFVTALTVVSA